MSKPTSEMKEVLNNLEKLHLEPIESLTPSAARQQAEVKDAVMATINDHAMKRMMGFIEPVVKVEHKTIRGQGGEIMLRIYHPVKDEDIMLYPATLYFHGGGMVFANLNTYDASCRALCNAAKMVVISVAYHQAPEQPFPAAPNDAITAYEWLLDNGDYFGVDVHKIAVVGESAGGNLAAGLCLQAKDRGLPQPVHQVLIYPMLNAKFDTPSYQEHADAKPLNKAMMQWFWGHYLSNPSQQDDPIACPLKADSFVGLAPATIILAEIDPLKDDGEQYFDCLNEAGVEVNCKLYKGVTHEFFGMGAVVSEAKDAVKFVAEQLIAAFENATPGITPAPEEANLPIELSPQIYF